VQHQLRLQQDSVHHCMLGVSFLHILSTGAAQGDWVRTVAKQEGIPVFVVKSGGRANLVKALRTLLGIDPSAGGALLGGPQADDSRQRADGAIVSQVRPCCRLHTEEHICFC
jgi:hypothetical protein